jgi:nicotinamidase-related amidase
VYGRGNSCLVKYQNQVHTEAIVIKKGVTPYIDSYSAFFDNGKLKHTELEELIRKMEITDLYVCGIAYDVCVGEFGTDNKMNCANILSDLSARNMLLG